MFSAFADLADKGRSGPGSKPRAVWQTWPRPAERLLGRRNWTVQAVRNFAQAAQATDDARLQIHYLTGRASRRIGARDVARTMGAVLAAFAKDADRPIAKVEIEAAVGMLAREAPLLAGPRERGLAIGLAAATAAAFGWQVHVVVADERRAVEIADLWQNAFGRIGLGFGLVQNGQSIATRTLQYRKPVVFSAVSQIATDYLRDALVDTAQSKLRIRIDKLSGSQSQDGKRCGVALDFAIVDAIDTVLCEGGITSFALPGTTGVQSQLLLQLRGLAERLRADDDYVRIGNDVSLTPPGQETLQLLGNLVGPPWAILSPVEKEKLIRLALVAGNLDRGQHYQLEGRRIVLSSSLDELAAETCAQIGLVDIVGAMEGLNAAAQPVARISIRRLIDRYRRVAGVAAYSDASMPELRGRFGLISRRNQPESRFAVEPLPETDREDAIFAKRLQVAIDDQSRVIVVAADPSSAKRSAEALHRMNISHAELKGAPAESDGELLLRALHETGIAVTPIGRDWTKFPDFGEMAKDLKIVIVGFEDALITPGWMIAHLPPALRRSSIVIMPRLTSPILRDRMSSLQRYLTAGCSTDSGRWRHRLTGWMISGKIRSAAAIRANKRVQLDRSEDARIAGLPFAGHVSGRL